MMSEKFEIKCYPEKGNYVGNKYAAEAHYYKLKYLAAQKKITKTYIWAAFAIFFMFIAWLALLIKVVF
jgi:hypothetical protein